MLISSPRLFYVLPKKIMTWSERSKFKSMKNAGYVDAGCSYQRTLVRRLGVADLFGEALLVS